MASNFPSKFTDDNQASALMAVKESTLICKTVIITQQGISVERHYTRGKMEFAATNRTKKQCLVSLLISSVLNTLMEGWSQNVLCSCLIITAVISGIT